MKKYLLVVTSLVFINLLGCSGPTGPLSVLSSPDTFALKAQNVPKFKSGTSYMITNAYKAPVSVQLHKDANKEWVGDLQQYTQTAATMLGRYLEKEGLKPTENGSKTIELRVKDVISPFGWTVTATLTLEARLGNGQVLQVFAENNSPATANRAIDGALMKAVATMLTLDKFEKYINE
jgi:hypothetical protein